MGQTLFEEQRLHPQKTTVKQPKEKAPTDSHLSPILDFHGDFRISSIRIRMLKINHLAEKHRSYIRDWGYGENEQPTPNHTTTPPNSKLT